MTFKCNKTSFDAAHAYQIGIGANIATASAPENY